MIYKIPKWQMWYPLLILTFSLTHYYFVYEENVNLELMKVVANNRAIVTLGLVSMSWLKQMDIILAKPGRANKSQLRPKTSSWVC